MKKALHAKPFRLQMPGHTPRHARPEPARSKLLRGVSLCLAAVCLAASVSFQPATAATSMASLMCNIVAELDKAGMSDQWIMKNIGMDRDELLRLKQISGLADLFANREFSIPNEVAPTETERKTL